MGDAHSPVQAHSFGRILDALHASDQDAFATIAEIMPSQKRSASFFCHSERSEESLLSSMLTSMRCQPLLRDPSHSFRMTSMKAGYIKPRLRKSPRLPPEERSTRSMVNLSRQTSHASSTPWIIALSGSFLFSTCRLVRLITVSIESLSVCSFRSVLRN